MSSTLRGKASATQNSESITYSPQSGFAGEWIIEGPKASIQPLVNQLAAQGYSLRYTCDQSPKATLQYSTPGLTEPGGTETPTLVWEYMANVAEIDILEADINSVNAITDANKRVIREAIANPDPDNEPDFFQTADILAATDVYELMLSGVRSVRVNAPTLRRSMLVSGAYSIKASLDHVGSIMSTTTLIAQENIPSNLLFNLPDQTTTKPGRVYAWYKKHPTIQQAGGFRWNISQEWEYGLWSDLIYTIVT